MLLVLALLGATYVDDPLTASSFTTRTGSRGGTFSATGWTVTDEPDTIWYRIDDALTEARIEYTVTGMEVGAAPASLRGADHDILVVYNALASPAEPVPYAPGFRNNDFKFFTRIFGVLETGRPGAMKLELASCPQGDPWFHDSCPAGCGQDLIAYANGNQQSPGWNAATSYRMALWWNNGTAGFDRDGVTLGTVSYTGSYAPQPLMIRFGSPRHDGVYPGAAMMPIGITIKDVKITGTAGTRTLACGAPPPPPPPPPPADAGMVMPGANTLAVLQDVTVANWETGVFPDVNDLNVEGSGSAPTGVAYLRFPQFSGVVNKAILKLHSQAISSASGGSGEVCTVSDSTWQETTLTWAARPALGSCAGSARSVTPDVELEWDVTALYAAGAPAGLAVVSRDPDGTHLLSKESGGAARGPRLYLELSAAPPDAGVPDAGAPDAGVTDAGSTSPDAGSTPHDGGSGGNMMASSGCGCGAGGTGGSVLVLLAALLLLRRRHS